jgi:hypothetical protein
LDHADLLRRLGEGEPSLASPLSGLAMDDTTKPRPPIGVVAPPSTVTRQPVAASEPGPEDQGEVAASMELLVATGVVWVCAVVLAVYATLITVRH